ncbi:MAG: 30S ribosomal protein S7 [Candidatus Atabeyarchaeum deiterrae]
MSEPKLFGKWDFKDIKVNDVGLRKYISLKPVYIPHTGGRHEHSKFGKSQMPIVERFLNRLMKTGANTGKKHLATNIVKSAFEIIELKTGENPVKVLVQAIENAAPREETTRISYGGIVYHQSVDVAPQRRIDLAMRFIIAGASSASFKNPKTIDECLADEIMAVATKNPKAHAIQKKDEKERIALSAR